LIDKPPILSRWESKQIKHSLDFGHLQQEVAEPICASPWTMANWEEGQTDPPTRFSPKILRVLGCDPHK